MDELFSLNGSVALVTGASGGLGQAIALAFARHGANLILSDRKGTSLHEIAATCRKLGVHIFTVEADLSEPAQVERLGLSAVEKFGRLDILVCNAGMQGPAGPLLAIDRADWDAVFQVNLASAHALAAKLVPGMALRGGGRVILLASIAALRGNKAIGLYGLTKAALTQMARNLAVEWGPSGVTVNAIAPGLIRTPLAESLISDEIFMARRLGMTPLRRVGEPHEVAAVAVMLASAGGAFMTGQTLVVDGGTLISDGA
jgi:NAD(P)-dependent dehydrogenase (short-subunit alcohol dehydrogenase family)